MIQQLPTQKSAMRILFLLLFTGGLFMPVLSSAQAKGNAEASIRNLLAHQVDAWNRGDLQGFMQGYWNNDSLVFIGKNGFTYGWHSTLANYRKGYPDTAAMGKLHFDLLELKRISGKAYFVAGKWKLTRSIGNAGGAFSLLFRKIAGRWYIVADHSS